MKRLFFIVLVLMAGNCLFAEKHQVDSLLEKINRLTAVDQIIPELNRLSKMQSGGLSMERLAKDGLERSNKQNNTRQQEKFLFILCYADFLNGDYPSLLEHGLTGLKISETLNDKDYKSLFLERIGIAFSLEKDNVRACAFFRKALTEAVLSRDTSIMIHICANLGSTCIDLNRPDSALFFARYQYRLISLVSDTDKRTNNFAMAFVCLADAHAALNHPDSALFYYRSADSALFYYRSAGSLSGRYAPADLPILTNNIAQIYLKIGKADSAKKYALETYNNALAIKKYELVAHGAGMLSKLFEGTDDPKSLFYLKAEMAAKDSLNEGEKNKDFQIIANKEQRREEELKNAAFAYQAKIRFYGLITILLAVIVLVAIVWMAYKKQQKANELLLHQKTQIEDTLSKLKAAQLQLIQSEKMASLGELTAGIAHEIQNPLNFVNNFSEVNRELIEEVEQEIEKGDIAGVKTIMLDIKGNEIKINYHGKRADGIVKSMLEHSRSITGTKELTDINQLADEFMRISYHGLRAKDKTFNSELSNSFDPSLPQLNIVRQNIGRVLLNLFNNAFYAVNQKRKTAGENYRPEVSVSTYQENGNVIIKVRDNGTGIPQNIRDKIMQPFFTTKPTGEGTGLGLSLAFDIVVKGHGGEITVNSIPGEFTEFKVVLPLHHAM